MTVAAVDPYGLDIYTEPLGEPDTLTNLGPLRPMAGTWEGQKGSDDHPVFDGTEHNAFIEHYELEPIDFQTNGPQIFYGLRYHTHIVNPDEAPTFHDQVGYWLWEPLAGMVTLTLGIPRGQVLLATGPAEPDSTEFEVTAVLSSLTNGILSNPFLDRGFRTSSYRMHVTIDENDTWSYEEEGILEIPGREEPFHHLDRNTLRRVSVALPNPLAMKLANADKSLGIGSLRNENGNLL